CRERNPRSARAARRCAGSGPVLMGNEIAQAHECLPGPRLDRPGLHVQPIGDLTLGQALKVGQLQNLPMLRAEDVQGATDPLAHLLMRRVRGGVLSRWGSIGSRGLPGAQAGALAAEPIDGPVPRHGNGPRSDRSAPHIVGSRPTPDLEPALPQNLLRIRRFSHDAQGHGIEEAVVPVVELFERTGIAGPDPLEARSIAFLAVHEARSLRGGRGYHKQAYEQVWDGRDGAVVRTKRAFRSPAGKPAVGPLFWNAGVPTGDGCYALRERLTNQETEGTSAESPRKGDPHGSNSPAQQACPG